MSEQELNREKRIARVAAMEDRFDRVRGALAAMEAALTDWDAVRDDLRALAEYSDSGAWLCDFEADEAGELPPELKRGVLGEDALYDLLGEADELRARLKDS